MEKLSFFDSNCTVGTRQVRNPGSYYLLDDQLKKMAYYGIDRALACHASAIGYHPLEGNRMLADAVKGYPQFKPVWVALPHHTGEFPHPQELRHRMKASGVSAVTMLPKAHIYCFTEWVCGELYAMLEACEVPLFLSMEQVGFGELHSVLSSHPGLRVVLTNLHYNCARNLYPLMEKFDGLFAETIGLKFFGAIEDVCRRFGAQRLLFGTCAPVYAGSAAVGMVTYADISDDEKRMIASGNLDTLLGEVNL